MTHNEIVAMLEEAGLPLAYDHFAEGESPDPVFLWHTTTLLKASLRTRLFSYSCSRPRTTSPLTGESTKKSTRFISSCTRT